jgi:hypothetical protein
MFTKLCIFGKNLGCNPIMQTTIPGAEQQTNAAVAKEAGARRRRPQGGTLKCLKIFIFKMYSQNITIFACRFTCLEDIFWWKTPKQSS